MKLAWQTYVMLVLAIAQFAVAQVLANAAALSVEAPWILIVLLPTLATALTLAANQLKPIGGEPPAKPPTP